MIHKCIVLLANDTFMYHIRITRIFLVTKIVKTIIRTTTYKLKKRPMALKDYFPDKSEKKDLVEKLSAATLTSKSTVYRWLKGEILPPPIKQKVIADVMGISPDKLFPK